MHKNQLQEEVDEELLNKQIAKLIEAAHSANSAAVIKCFKEIEPTFSPNRDMIYNKDKATVNPIISDNSETPKLKLVVNEEVI